MTDAPLDGDSSATCHLLEASATGDAAATADLLARHRGWLHVVIQTRLDPRLTARIDASDVVQDVLAEAYRRLDNFLERRPVSFRTWLLKTAYDRLAKLERAHFVAARRSTRREVPLTEESSLHLAAALSARAAPPDEPVLLDERARQVRMALAELSDTDREVLLLRYVEGLNNHEIAFLMSMQPDAVSRRHGRALLKLHKRLANCLDE